MQKSRLFLVTLGALTLSTGPEAGGRPGPDASTSAVAPAVDR
jgi:hypothetical protein